MWPTSRPIARLVARKPLTRVLAEHYLHNVPTTGLRLCVYRALHR